MNNNWKTSNEKHYLSHVNRKPLFLTISPGLRSRKKKFQQLVNTSVYLNNIWKWRSFSAQPYEHSVKYQVSNYCMQSSNGIKMSPEGSLFYGSFPFAPIIISYSSTSTFSKDSSDHFLIAFQKQYLSTRKLTYLSNCPPRVVDRKLS